MKKALIIVSGISLFLLSSCATKPPVDVTVIYNVMPIDPPIVPTQAMECHAFGLDALACDSLTEI